MSEGERKPTPRNMSPDLRPETIFQIYRAYSEENIIQTWSGKHGERESHRDASNDESCNEMREHKWKGRQNEIIVEPSSSYRSQITKNHILKTKTRREYQW